MSELFTREQLEAIVNDIASFAAEGPFYRLSNEQRAQLLDHDASLRAQLAACEKERDEWKRLYAHRGEALKRACLQCGYTQKEMKPHD